jgi:hypothetical protein
MARPKNIDKDKENSEKDENIDSVKLAAQSFFKSNKEHIYTDVSEPFKVPTGVFSLDCLLDGGIGSGTQCRLLGPPSSGKSSEGLLIIKNFLDMRERCRALIIPTEARLTDKLQKRSGVPFVSHPDEWTNKTCLILPMNVYEKIANFLWTLVKTNEMRPKEERENLIVMIDCLDYLCLEGDILKEFGESRKIAGPQYLTKILWSKMALPFNAGQHIFLAVSQQSAAPKIDPYSKDPLRQGGSSGGSNIQYQASTVIDFSGRYEGDYILENPDSKYDPQKNIKIGHAVKGFIRKSDNEKYDVKFEYCVKYGRVDSNSIWVEREIFDQLVALSMVKRESAQGSFAINPDLLKELKSIDAEIPEKIRSLNRGYEYLESKPEVTKFLNQKLKNILTN